MKLSLRDMTQETILLEDVYDSATTELVSSLGPEDTFIDVGANVGYFTLLASQLAKRVLAIEPNPPIAELLRGNIARSRCQNVEVQEVACFDRQCELTLYCPEHTIVGSTSLSKENATRHAPRNVNTVARRVRAIELDTLIQLGEYAPTVIKMDVEGAEASALRGMVRTLDRYRPKLILELCPELLCQMGSSREQITTFLSQFSYSCVPTGEDFNYLFTT